MRSTLPGLTINVNKYQRLKQTLKSMKKNGVNSRFRIGSAGNLLKKMKLLIAFFFAGLLGVSASTYSQQTKLSISLDKATVKEAFKQIEKNSEFVFFYNEDYIDVNRKININVTDETIEIILNELLKGTQNTFKIYDRQVVILSPEVNESPSFIKSETNTEQKKEITGTVKDGKGLPLPGVTVYLKGSSMGTITDNDGKFKLTVSGDAKTIIFSFVGMKSQEIPIGSKTVFNIIMTEETVGLDEVIAIGYGTMRKIDMTGSAASVQTKDMMKAPVKSFDEALAGRVAGVQVVSADGQPGSMPNIIIRGANSLTQDNSPLYVIDGFPIEGNDNNAINTNDIESINILKDASATAIYGARGANGVIMITTKRGNAGAPVVSYNSYYGIQKDIKRITTLSPYEFVKLQLERDLPGGTLQYLTTPGRTLDDYKTMKGVDWFEKCLQSAPMQNHDISVRGGNEKSKYSVSGSYFGQDGIFINTGYRRWQGRITLDQVINDKISFGINTNYSDTKNYGLVAANGSGSAGIMYSLWAFRPVLEDNINLDFDLMDPSINPATDYRTNPYVQLKNEHRVDLSNSLMASGYLDYTICPGLKLRVTGGVNKGTYRNDIFNNSKTSTGNPASIQYKGINGSEAISTNSNYSNENTLTWTRKFGKAHNLNVMGGFSQQMGRSDRFGATAVMITNEPLGMDALDEGSPTRIDANSSVWSLQSFLCRVNYNYNSKYLFTASVRADGSSKLAQANRWGYFPSAALAYRLSEEKFIKKLSFVNDAKFRISYGATGNNRVSDFAYTSTISSSYNDYSFGNAYPSPGSRATALGNAALKWETTTQTNVGLDLSVLNNRITFTGDYYYKKTTDLLLNAAIPYTSGYANTYKNIGSVCNSGIELSVNTFNVQKADFKWNSSFNISFNRNKVLSLTEGQEALTSVLNNSGSPSYIAKVGHPIALFYGVMNDGLYSYSDFNQLSNGTYILKDNIPSNGNTRNLVKPGDAKFKDINGDLNVNSSDLTIIGDPNPDFIGGFNNNFQYKGFDLSIFIQFSYGNDVFNANRFQFEGGANTQSNTNFYSEYANRWTVDNPNGIYPRVGGYVAQTFSSRYVEDGSFLRLKTVSLGYSIPDIVLKPLNIKSVRLYCTSQNLYTWTGYKGLDPEVSTRNSALTPGFDWSPYPRAKSIVFGLNLTF